MKADKSNGPRPRPRGCIEVAFNSNGINNTTNFSFLFFFFLARYSKYDEEKV